MRRLFLAAVLSFAGCVAHRLPTYPPGGATDALNIIAARDRSVRSVQAAATIKLTSNDRSIVLDGVICFDEHDRLRVRAWKLGQAVFDVTVNEGGVWRYAPREEARRSAPLTASVVTRFKHVLLGDDLSILSQGTGVAHLTSGSVSFTTPAPDGTVETRLYDRATLTLRRFTVDDASGVERFRLDFSDYRVIDGTAWPTTLRATGEGGEIDVRMDDVQINQPLPPQVFTPPARAERLQ